MNIRLEPIPISETELVEFLKSIQKGERKCENAVEPADGINTMMM